MKYPQLVSTRAVNAISDWLVSRLEQLGVEAPQIYTRLLLSLLQSSVQINDPIEFSNLETFFASRKGSNRRHLPCDTDTLKKLNAVQCLREIVSSEQEIATIENLVDELCEKLQDIEKQLANIEDENELLVATLSVATVATVSTQQAATHSAQQQQQQHNNSSCQQPHGHNNNNNNKYQNQSSHKQESQEHKQLTAGGTVAAAGAATADSETDPKKRYFRAFPALTKEMEDSFRVWRRNAKLLTWPVVDRSNISVSSSSSSSSTNSTSFDSSNVAQQRAADKRVVGKSATNLSNRTAAVGVGNYCQGDSSTAVVSGGVKRKPKRRRNQALSKGKTIQNIRKNSTGNTVTGGAGGGTYAGKHHRYSSPTFWDTDFEGCWEMGRDLIKEFIVKQNKNNRNRNRSTSESAAYNMRQHANADDLDYEVEACARATAQTMILHEHELADTTQRGVVALSRTSSPLLPIVDISFCCDDDDEEVDDTLACVSELAADNCCYTTTAAAAAPARRLYQRDVGLGTRELLPDEETTDEQLDFEQFKAKFNSNVEALWKDADPPADADDIDVFSYSSSSMQMPSLPAVAPFKENLKNFWSNYYNHHFDVATIAPEELHEGAAMSSLPMITAANPMEESASLSCVGPVTALHVDIPNTSDYYSMPSNLPDFDKSVGGARRDFGVVGVGAGVNAEERNNTPIGLFLQTSIWSDNSNGAAGDTDESFYYKVWNSNKKLTQLDALRENAKLNKSIGLLQSSGGGHETAFHFPTYPISKWSEGINAGPQHVQQQQPQAQFQPRLMPTIASNSNNNNANINNNGYNIDCTDSSTTASVSSTSCSSLSYTHSSGAAAAAFNWETPVLGQGLQADLQSWSSSNPVSLTEMYGGDGGVNSSTTAAERGKRVSETAAPSLTLANHSPSGSGFVEYALIKSDMKALKQERAHQQLNYATQLSRPAEHYPDDENLLTSDRTHFHPIKTFADGHTFDICSSLDVIDYERSASGYLYLDTDKYLEYMRNDSYLVEDDVGAASMNPLYAASNCEAATSARQAAAGGKSRKARDFDIKFRMRTTDMACQTDDATDLLAAAAAAKTAIALAAPHPLCFLLSDAATNLTGHALAGCNDSIEALNKAVAAAAKAAVAAHLPADGQYSHWLPVVTTAAASGTATYRPRDTIWTAAQSLNDEQGCDEADFCATIGRPIEKAAPLYADDSSNSGSGTLEQQWSMHEIRKRCQLKGHGSGSGNNSGGGNNNNDDESIHTLWGMCAACNSEYKSVPANRLLRDELKLEADEIMSDLKYMQDLYIGRAEGDYDKSEGEGDCEANAGSATSDSDWEGERQEERVQNKALVQTCAAGAFSARQQAEDTSSKVEAMEHDDDDDDDILLLPEPQAQEVLLKVNRIIVDLLRPENVQQQEQQQQQELSLQAPSLLTLGQSVDGGGCGLWATSGNSGGDIWQQAEALVDNATVVQPVTGGGSGLLLQHYDTQAPQASELRVDEHKFLSQLSWEHTNLAEIWQKNTPPPPPSALVTLTPTTAGGSPAATNDFILFDNNNEAGYQHNKQLQSTSTVATPALALPINESSFVVPDEQQLSAAQAAGPAASTVAAYKRVQDFLDANAVVASNKLKLANRKRRHSASQNYFHQHHHHHHLPGAIASITAAAAAAAAANMRSNTTSATKNNNNSLEVADLNSFNLKLNSSTIYADDIDVQKFINSSLRQALAANDVSSNCSVLDDVYGSATAGVADMDGLNEAKQTIITCKWTTIDPMYDEVSDAVDGTAFSCLIDKNASILKHVTMVTRPLTR